MTLRCSTHRLLREVRKGAVASAGLFALALVTVFTAPAFAAPVLDGNIDDVIAQANTYIQNGTGCGLIINDPAKDVCLSDPLIIPCTNNLSTCLAAGQYYVNGFDQILAVAAVQGTDAWWGMRVVGQIGDSDGDGTDAKGSNCPPPGLGQNPEDGPGIAEGERYIFRLDTNCDGSTDIRITVLGGAGTHQPNVIITDGTGLNPIPGATGSAMYGTTDLEIHTTGLNLPPVFSMSTFAGSDFDGLSEDAAGPALCAPPTASLSIQKSVDKPSICAGDKDRFTLSVTNTGTGTLSINVRDVLPPGWTYANNVSGDFAFSGQNGQVVSFGPLSVPPGQSKTVSFDATSPSDCLGPYENKAVADGSFSIPCLQEPQTALTDTARATVTCSAKPCVSNVHCTAPATACNGDQVSLKAFATNCGDRAADIVITLQGHDHIANNVGAGQQAEFDTTITFSCTPSQSTTFNVSAVAKNSCGTSDAGTSSCSTLCGAAPCVNNVSCQAPATACDGTPILLKGFATNCGSGTEELVITFSGPGGTIGSHAFNVTAGGQAEFDTTITLHCTPGAASNYTASAVARNGCGTSAPSTSTGCTVQCQVGPCLDQVSCSTSASTLCDGSSLKLTGSAHNCGSAPEQIVLTLLGPGSTVLAARAFNVAAGATQTYDTTFTFHCTGTESKTYTVSAVATNGCGSTPPSTSSGCPVTCAPQPCVDQVSCSTSATSLLDGSSLKLTGSAHNCSTGPEQMVFTLLGPGNVVLASRAFNVAAGATQTYDTTFVFHCTGTETKVYQASVVATNSCGTSTPVMSGDGCPVTCKSQPPCVNNVHCSVPAQACDGDQIKVSGFATNCSVDVEQVVITLTGPNGVIGSHAFNVSAGGVAQFDTTVAFHCTGGQQLQYNASAVGTNQTGSTQPVASTGCSIVCKQPPCVNNVHCSVPASACDGSSIKLSGFATNCCVNTEEIVITLSGPGGVIGSHAFNVAAGGVAQFDTTITLHCTSGASVSYSASAVARNDCGASQPVASVDPCTVQCKQPPCVTNVRCEVPATACDGSRIKLSGFAANCCAGTEEIIITLSGPDGTIGSHAFNVSAAGIAQFDTTITLHCTSGSSTTFHASAVARNECATTTPVTSDGCTVQCGTPPCVDQVSCSTSAASLCDGQPLKLTGTAHNCSASTEEIVITLLGPSNEALASRAFNVAAGASVSYDTTITFHCSLGTGDAKMYNLAVVARNGCGATNTVTCTGCSVKCGPGPCVDQVFCNTNPSVLQDGGQLKLTGHARNCSDHTEEFVIKLLAPGHVVIASRAFNVAAGGEVTYDTTFTFHCSGTETKTYNLEVTPRDACGTGPTVTCLGCTVTCSGGGTSSGPRCVTVRCDAPSSAADGDQITVSAIAHNCSDHTEDIRVCILQSSSGEHSLDGGTGGGSVGCHWLRGVPAGADARFDTTITFHCQSGGDDGGGDDGRTRSLDGGSGGTGTTFSATAQAFDASGAGSIVSSASKCPVTCQGGGTSGGGSCPRNICYWLKQCGSGGDDGGGDDGRSRSLDGGSGGSLTKSQMTAIAGCIDSHSDFFHWSDDVQGFCSAINVKPEDCKKQAIREFATLLANACIGQLGIQDATGAKIHLDLNAPNPCHSNFPGAATIGDLITAMDNLLVQLQNNNTDSQSSDWCKVSDCARQINEGHGITLDCRSGDGGDDRPNRSNISGTHPTGGSDGSGDESECSGSGSGDGGGDEDLQLEHPTPNPFSNTTGFIYKVGGTTTQRVQIGIYNVAGRLMRQLVNTQVGPGQYSTVWDGRDQGGSLVARGVYFIRGYVNGVRISGASRVLYLK